MSKIVVLNSGGFDSVVLMNVLYNDLEKGNELYPIYFSYGNLNNAQQLECASKVSEKTGSVLKVVNLPEFNWTHGSFYNSGNWEYSSQYLEYRNLVFLSYALSYAESIGATKVYLATLEGHEYKDTNPIFFEGLNHFSKTLSGIEICTPFAWVKDKIDIIPFAIECGVKENDFFSCDQPKENGDPCGECGDCISLVPIKDILKDNTPLKRFISSHCDYTDQEFKKLLVEQPVKELRVLHNNNCQLQCKHCFYGFEDTVSPILPKEKIYDAIVQASELGVENIHFSGKEPLYNDDILWYANKIQNDNLPLTFNLVSNGINVPKYIGELKNYGMNRLYLSVDEILGTKGVRTVENVSEKAIQSTIEAGVPIEIFIDLHQNNCHKLGDIIDYLLTRYPTGIDGFFIRTIRSVGNAISIPLLTARELEDVHIQLCKVIKKYPKISFILSLGIEYDSIVCDTHKLKESLIMLDYYRTNYVDTNFQIILESFCSRYGSSVTLTPDGYLLGCAMEISSPDYHKLSVGNIKDHSLKDLISTGKKLIPHINNQYCGVKCKKCSFLCNPLVKE